MAPENTSSEIAAPAGKVEQIAELLRLLCLAESNIGMYSADHPVARRFIKSAFDQLSLLLKERKGPLAITIADDRFVLDGLPMEIRNPMVAKFAHRLAEIHINTLFFQPNLTYEDFEAFNAILGKGPKHINEGGGLESLMKTAGIKTVVLQDVSYVMIRDDEKVVARDARVVEGEIMDHTSGDAAIVNNLVKEVLKEADQQKWMITEAKNNPKHLASQIVEGMQIAITRAENGEASEADVLGTLLNNIRVVGSGLVDTDAEPAQGDDQPLEQAVLTLEKEIRLRSQKLTTSKTAAAFVNEVMTVITSFSDRVKSKQISQEFLKGESGMKKAELLLRRVAARTESPVDFLTRVRGELIRQGMDKDTIDKLEREIQEGETKRKAPRKQRKPPSQDIQQGIARQMKALGIDETKMPDIVQKIGAFVENRVKEKEREFRGKVDSLSHKVSARDVILKSIEAGIVLWDDEGKIDLINDTAAAQFPLKAESEVPEKLRTAIAAKTFPIADVAAEFPASLGWTEQDRRIVAVISAPVQDDNGNLVGVILGH